ncbi:unnamed protein product [Bemisia tabaci]|uniref:RNA helicase n=1 Tax=Bemisia tabaci TaxID=7038 RepID=A0A9P0CBU0_BEMTA|nr:unnamed protein product [Bemisia tabaci]
MIGKFLKPSGGDCLWEEDKTDVDQTSGTAFVFNANVSLSVDQQKQRLPIFESRLHILYLLEQYQVLVLVGETGCGKSTQVPQILYEAGWCENGRMVGITEPRRVGATSLAKRVAEEMHSHLGQLVGYAIRFDDASDPSTTKIKYMTEGILLREMMSDPLLRKYSVIMLDEVHERTLLTDILLGLLKKILRKRKDLKLIVASATVDAEELRDFFNQNKKKKEMASIISIEGRLYSISVFYSKEPVPNYVKGCVETAIKVHEHELPGDILIFLPGKEEVDTAVEMLREHGNQIKRSDKKLLVLPLYGSLPNSEQLKVFRYTPRGLRKIVVATNIAETSVTIPGIAYVIDCGFQKLKWFNPESQTDALITVPISQASADQRAGRSGRERPGKVFRLYTESAYSELSEATPPEMQRTELSSAILQLKALGISNILRFPFPSPPPAKNVLSALELLFALGALDERGNLTEPTGLQMAEFPLPPLYSKALLVSGDMGCSEEMASIIALMQVQNIFTRPQGGQASIKAKVEKRKFEVEEGDLLTYLNTYNSYVKHLEDEKEWCHKRFLNYKALRRSTELRERILRLLRKMDVPIVSCKGNSVKICRCIAASFYPNAAYLHPSGVYRSVRGQQDFYIHPTSVLYNVQQPQWILYCELLHTDKIYMNELTAIDPAWLEELAPHFYHKTSVDYG